VTNYRSIQDSGEVRVSDFKTLVGKNESGKTSILKALHKFNPATEERFNGLREFPRRKFHEFDKRAPVVRATFSLSEEENDALYNIDPRFRKVSGVGVTKNYAGDFTVDLMPDIESLPPTRRGLAPLLRELKAAIDEIGKTSDDTVLALQTQLVEAYGQLGTGLGEDTDISSSPVREPFETQVQSLLKLVGPHAGKENFASVQEIAVMILNTANWEGVLSKVRNYVVKHLPVFVYFENYAIIDSRIHLPSFVQKSQSGALNPEERTAKTLFTLVKLNPERLVALASAPGKNPVQIQEGIDERALLVDRASLSLTGNLADLWQQRKNRIDFDIDGEYLRLWVTDDVDKSKIELEQRSKGFQWFLSFYVVFNVESELGHKNAVLLLDEPGLHLHAAAQEDILAVLQKLAERNQIIYTTHSPFMIDTEHLDTISTVIENKEDGTKVSDAVWGTDKDALFPLQAALGYSMSQSLFVGRYNLVVEGITDFWILSTISQIFKDSQRLHINEGIVISPAGGAQKAALLAAMLSGQKLKVGVLLDSDIEGRNVRNDLVKSRIAKENNVIFISDATGDPEKEMELEDLMPIDIYMRVVNETYLKELGTNPLSISIKKTALPIRRSLEEEFAKRGLVFSKFRVARRLMEDLPRIPFSQLPADFVGRVEKLFALINKIRPVSATTATDAANIVIQ
jgi:predicted ATP-dependent endonuclease of OLD family